VDNNKKTSTEYEFNNQYNRKFVTVTPNKWKHWHNNISNARITQYSGAFI